MTAEPDFPDGVAIPMLTGADQPTVRPMRAEDAVAIVAMARALAAAVDDPEPKLTGADLIRDGVAPGRWFACFVAEASGAPVGYALACKTFEAHTGNRRLWLG